MSVHAFVGPTTLGISPDDIFVSGVGDPATYLAQVCGSQTPTLNDVGAVASDTLGTDLGGLGGGDASTAPSAASCRQVDLGLAMVRAMELDHSDMQNILLMLCVSMFGLRIIAFGLYVARERLNDSCTEVKAGEALVRLTSHDGDATAAAPFSAGHPSNLPGATAGGVGMGMAQSPAAFSEIEGVDRPQVLSHGHTPPCGDLPNHRLCFNRVSGGESAVWRCSRRRRSVLMLLCT